MSLKHNIRGKAAKEREGQREPQEGGAPRRGTQLQTSRWQTEPPSRGRALAPGESRQSLAWKEGRRRAGSSVARHLRNQGRQSYHQE